MKLSDLKPGDVAVMIHANGVESEPFVIEDDNGEDVLRTPNSSHKLNGLVLGTTVRRLGRGRLIPAHIEMDTIEEAAP